jgi:chromosome segregation ATPase
MSQTARVGSIDALKSLYAALTHFGPEAQEALGAAEIEIRRVFDYLNDQLKYWQRMVEKCRENVNRARNDLAHARAMRKGEASGTVEQEIALRKAQNQLREAEEKVVTVKRWILQLPQAVNEYEGPARRLAGLLDADFKQGLVLLENKIAALEAYAEVHVSQPSSPPPAPPPPVPPVGGPS